MSLGAAFGGVNELVKDSAGTIHVILAVADGVYTLPWDGVRWGDPEQIDNRYIDPHEQHMIVCQGNQLHVVYYDRTGQNTVWYTTRQVSGPNKARQPLPTEKPTDQTGAVVAFPTELPKTAQPTKILALGQSNLNIPSPNIPIILGLLPVFLLIIGVWLVYKLVLHKQS